MIWPFHIHRACTSGLHVKCSMGVLPKLASRLALLVRFPSIGCAMYLAFPSRPFISLFFFQYLFFSHLWQVLLYQLAAAESHQYMNSQQQHNTATLSPRLPSPTAFEVNTWRIMIPVELPFLLKTALYLACRLSFRSLVHEECRFDGERHYWST